MCVCSYYNYNGLWKLVEVTEISANGFSIKVRQPGKALERTIYFSDFSPKLAEKGSKATDARIGEETELVDVEKIAAMERQVRINIFCLQHSSYFTLLLLLNIYFSLCGVFSNKLNSLMIYD